MSKYDHKKIEKKWIKYWDERPEFYSASDSSDSSKQYILDMFPYPSGDGLHTGHVESYTATDIISRYLRMNGKNVLHPQGWDAFGLPAENYAIKTKVHPSITTRQAIANFKRQMKMMGFSYDWSREVDSSDPNYYKWTQWFFLLLYKNGLACKKKGKVNWCANCQTTLANEQAEGGVCDRCGREVVQKELEQWYFKITDFIEDKGKTSGLLNGLDKIDWPESTKAGQRNWVGKSEGAQFKMEIVGTDKFLEVFTTRLDTVFGMTFALIAPEHKLVQELKDKIENWKEVEKYIAETKKKSELQRITEAKEKTGVELRGIKVLNPFTRKEIQLFASDFVLGHYGTGAVMAVPAHDERDWDFARKFGLPIEGVIVPAGQDVVGIGALIEDAEGHFIFQKRDEKTKNDPGRIASFGGGLEEKESYLSALKRELKEELDIELDSLEIWTIGWFRSHNFLGQFINMFYVRLKEGQSMKLKEGAGIVSLTLKEALEHLELTDFTKEVIKDFQDRNNFAYTEDGILVNSGEFNRLTSAEARKKLTQWLEKEGIGHGTINYKLRDWLVSRQRYWGAPIPVVYCRKCQELKTQKAKGKITTQNSKPENTAVIDGAEYAIVPVPEKDLPVMLPTDVDFMPTGESPLKKSKTFHDIRCPVCGGKAIRESDTMDTFVCSSWYYFRYADPKNPKEFASKHLLKKWLPVDLYVGGAEHTVLHLLYSRFFTKVLHNLGYIDFDEPFAKMRHQGILLAEDGRKMSKSLGNVINPDDVVAEYGADALRMFEMFMGPLEDAKPWNTKGIVGISRFLERVWRMRNRIKNQESRIRNKEIEILLNKTIKKVGEDIENLKFNTAISALMIFLNQLEKQEEISLIHYSKFIIILSPFAPFMTEELWSKVRPEQSRGESIFKEKWPEYDENLIKDEQIEMIVQVNGKMRGKISVPASISEEEAKKLALADENVQKWLEGKDPRKIIFVKGRLVNIAI